MACLASYNNGELHGAWVDAMQGAEYIREAIGAVLKTSPEPQAEEWAIHDYEGFGSIGIGEYEDIDHVAAIGEFVAEHARLGAELISHTGSLDEARDVLDNRYAGVHESLAELAEQLLDDQGILNDVPECLRGYIDFAAYGRDLVLGGEFDTLEVDGQLHVFWAR